MLDENVQSKTWLKPKNKGMRHILEQYRKTTMSHMSIIIWYRIPKCRAMAAWTTVITNAPDTFAERKNQPTHLLQESLSWVTHSWHSGYWQAKMRSIKALETCFYVSVWMWPWIGLTLRSGFCPLQSDSLDQNSRSHLTLNSHESASTMATTEVTPRLQGAHALAVWLPEGMGATAAGWLSPNGDILGKQWTSWTILRGHCPSNFLLAVSVMQWFALVFKAVIYRVSSLSDKWEVR